MEPVEGHATSRLHPGRFANADQFACYLENAPVRIAVTTGPNHILVCANSAFRALLPTPESGSPGRSLADAFPEAEAGELRAILDDVLHSGAAAEHYGDLPRGTWLHGRSLSVWRVTHEDDADGLGIEVTDITQTGFSQDLQRQLSERMLLAALRERDVADTAEAARKRAVFLAHAGRLLAESLDRASTLITLTRLTLPVLDAWCIVDILAADGTIRRLGIIHANPEKQYLASQLEGRWLPQPDDPIGASAMMRSTDTLAINVNIDLTIAAASNGEDNRRILKELGICWFLTVPLLARGKLLGAVTFVGTRADSPLAAADIELAEDIVARAAMALDSAQVHDEALGLKRAAESANQAKTAFLGAMSHELRTPLNAIGGYIELIDMGLRGPVTEAQHTDLARVKASQQHLLILVTEILNFVRVGSGRVLYDISNVNACGALKRGVELIEPLIGRKGLKWDGVTGDAKLMMRADPEKVTQIVVNLLSNAIKFTDAGGALSVNCVAVDDKVLLIVADTGRGIPPEKFESVFEPFIQLKDGLADRESGVGLGLAISRDLARAMNGDIVVESEEGEGSRFTLTLPRAMEPSAAASTPAN